MTEMRRKKEKPLNSIAEDFSLPLTEAQKEMWLAARISDAALRAYNNTFVIHLRGDLKSTHCFSACRNSSTVTTPSGLRSISRSRSSMLLPPSLSKCL